MLILVRLMAAMALMMASTGAAFGQSGPAATESPDGTRPSAPLLARCLRPLQVRARYSEVVQRTGRRYQQYNPHEPLSSRIARPLRRATDVIRDVGDNIVSFRRELRLFDLIKVL